jgi:hypothetical protein
MRSDARALVGVDHREQELGGGAARLRRQLVHDFQQTGGLQRSKFAREFRALRGQVEEALAAIDDAGARLDEAALDELLEDAVEALLGDPQYVEQRRDREARAAIDEMEHAVMRSAKAVIFKEPVSVAHEIAVGEKKQLYELERVPVARASRRISDQFPQSRDGSRLADFSRYEFIHAGSCLTFAASYLRQLY